jgi:hypothetical protein
MEIQYAIFCAYAGFPKATLGSVVLIKPISHFIVENIQDAEITLYTTFINCTFGAHKFKIVASNLAGEIITTGDFDFECTGAFLSFAQCFVIKFPVRKTDLLTFKLYLDGQEQKEIKLPLQVG